ncbi:MAG: glutamate racemase [Marinobacter sp.]|nr:glutamate racemase [Marinobacter sp.]
MQQPQVLIFDSGVGGLSVAQCVHQRLPACALHYLADNAFFPYGEQPEDLLIERCVRLIQKYLQRHTIDLVVIACNTASTVVLPHLRAAISQPVVGVVPAIKPAAALSRNRRIGLLATPATVRRPYLEQLIGDFASDCEITRVGEPVLVRWIEEWVAGKSLPEQELALLLRPFGAADVDTVVLGCTHYPLITEALQRACPSVSDWVDSGEAIARRTADLLGPAASAPVAPASVQAHFTGPLPAALGAFMARIGLPPVALSSDTPEAC